MGTSNDAKACFSLCRASSDPLARPGRLVGIIMDRELATIRGLHIGFILGNEERGHSSGINIRGRSPPHCLLFVNQKWLGCINSTGSSVRLQCSHRWNKVPSQANTMDAAIFVPSLKVNSVLLFGPKSWSMAVRDLLGRMRLGVEAISQFRAHSFHATF